MIGSIILPIKIKAKKKVQEIKEKKKIKLKKGEELKTISSWNTDGQN